MKLVQIIKSYKEMIALSWNAHPSAFSALILVDILQSALPLASAWVTKLLFDQLAASLQGNIISLNSILLILSLYATLSMLVQFLRPINNFLNSEINRQLSIKIPTTVFTKVNSLEGLLPFEDSKTRDTLQIGMQGGHMGPSQALSTLTSFLHDTITLVGFLGVLVTFNSLLAFLILLAALPQIYVETAMGHQRFKLVVENNQKQRRANYYAGLLSATHIVKELRLFDLGKYFLGRFEQLTQQVNQIQRTQERKELHWQLLLNFFATLVSSSAFIIVLIQAFRYHLSLGDVTLYISAFSSVQNALIGIIFAFSNVHESSLFFNRYSSLLSLPQPIHVSSKPLPTPPLRAAIELRNVSFRYDDGQPWVLSNLNLNIPSGKCLGLVGLNGAGKTTLVKLLTRMYDPSEGQVLWDGVDIKEFSPSSLRRHIGAIFQDFAKFDFTVFENIIFGDLDKLINKDRASVDEDVQLAAYKSGIHETIQRLPQGYETILSRWLVDDGCVGVDLSGGEWQKIALARLFVRDAEFLILDEPTAALDAKSEYDLYNRFVELAKGRTTLLISHRFSTVRMADSICVLDGGEIVEYGTHDELIDLTGTYAKLYQMQANQYR